MQEIKLNEATANYRWVPFRCLDDDSADNYAPKTGLTFASGELKIAKRGLTSAAAANYATVVEASDGWYWYQLSVGECDSLGAGMLIVSKTDVFADAAHFQIVATDPQDANAGGLARLDVAVSSRLDSADYEDLATMLDDADTVETGLTLRGFFKDAAAALFGETANGGTQMKAAKTAHKVRITSTVSGNDRTSVTTDET